MIPTWLLLGLTWCLWMRAKSTDLCQEWVYDEENKQPILREVCCNGYAGSPQNCRPICNPSCVHARCTAPQQCTCNDGYETVNGENSTMGCQPKCQDCRFGDCIAPGVCTCWPAYFKKANEGCQPISKRLLPPEGCLKNCICWQPHSTLASLLKFSSKCINICGRGMPQPCLDLSQCLCNSLNHFLICQDGVYTQPQQYACRLMKRSRGVAEDQRDWHKREDQKELFNEEVPKDQLRPKRNETHPIYQQLNSPKTQKDGININVQNNMNLQNQTNETYLSYWPGGEEPITARRVHITDVFLWPLIIGAIIIFLVALGFVIIVCFRNRSIFHENPEIARNC